MKLTVITGEAILDGEGALLNRLFDAGMELLHLRKPVATEAQLGYILEQTDPEYHGRIVLHDHFDLLRSFGLKGVHLNSRNPLRPLFPISSVSCSCHSLERLGEAADSHDYMFLSPVFDSISKSGYKRAFTQEQILDARSKGTINGKVVALGGIDVQTIPAAASYGFGGVAVLGALWGGYLRDGDDGALLKRFMDLREIAAK